MFKCVSYFCTTKRSHKAINVNKDDASTDDGRRLINNKTRLNFLSIICDKLLDKFTRKLQIFS